MSATLSIVVPMRNESAVLPELLAHLRLWLDRGCEIVVVDGGSDDGSAEMARNAGFAVIDAPPGRARQMNTGARTATTPFLLFLHADTRLPEGAERMVTAALSARRVWGRFDVAIDGRARMLRLIGASINMRSRLSGIATGDQAIFVRRESFTALGGYADMPLMEDLDLSRRLRCMSRPVCLRAKVRTSGRRWESRGVWRTILLMWRLRLAYWLGVPPDRLARAYR